MTRTTLGDVIAGRPLYHVAPSQSVRDAADLMARHGVCALAVVDGGVLCGILSERDILRRGVCADLYLRATPVRDLMTADPVTADTGLSMAEGLGLMLRSGFRHLPVVAEGTAVGMVSIRDVPTMTRALTERYQEFRSSKPGQRMSIVG